MTIKSFASIVSVMILGSCTPDDSSPSQSEIVDHYIITSSTEYSDGNPDTEIITTGNLVNGKFHSIAWENYIGGELQASGNVQQYFYDGDLLITTSMENDVKNFYYDATNNLTGIKWDHHGTHNYYRFVHLSQEEVYFERTNLPYDNPSAEIIYRKILFFDANDNIIKAGPDFDLDGELDFENILAYENDNLVQITTPNTTTNFQYSNTVNTHRVIAENSYSKRVLRLLCGEVYAGSPSSNLEHSTNLLDTEMASAEFEVAANGMYTKKTQINSMPEIAATNTVITEYFFD